MRYYSETTGKYYEAESSVFYRNLVQAAWLLSKPDATLLDIFCDGNGKMVLVFPKELHKKYVGEWAERSREIKGKDNG
jgi:hypothetical protein